MDRGHGRRGALPAASGQTGSPVARTDVYGYLLATVMSDGSIQFDFNEISLDDLRAGQCG